MYMYMYMRVRVLLQPLVLTFVISVVTSHVVRVTLQIEMPICVGVLTCICFIYMYFCVWRCVHVQVEQLKSVSKRVRLGKHGTIMLVPIFLMHIY